MIFDICAAANPNSRIFYALLIDAPNGLISKYLLGGKHMELHFTTVAKASLLAVVFLGSEANAAQASAYASTSFNGSVIEANADTSQPIRAETSAKQGSNVLSRAYADLSTGNIGVEVVPAGGYQLLGFGGTASGYLFDGLQFDLPDGQTSAWIPFSFLVDGQVGSGPEYCTACTQLYWALGIREFGNYILDKARPLSH